MCRAAMLFGRETIRNVNFDCALALDRYCLKLIGIEFDVFAFCDLVALYDVGLLDLIAGVGIDLAIPDPIAGLLID